MIIQDDKDDPMILTIAFYFLVSYVYKIVIHIEM